MKIKTLLSLFCLLFLYTAQSYAQTPPSAVTRVYRMDTRNPNVIFRPVEGGFSPAGTNDNIAEHVQVASFPNPGPPEEASIFVSTSASRDFAIHWGSDFLHGETFYVYEIRPTSNFYNAMSSLQALYNQTGNREYLTLIRAYEEQEEYAAREGIAVTQIVNAREFVYDPNTYRYVEGELRVNQDYEEEDTTVNPDPYIPVSQAPSTSHIIEPVTSCALNLDKFHFDHMMIRMSDKMDKYSFLKELKACHNSLLLNAFLNEIYL
ncbi:enterotoxin A family protein [Xenorhabdus szentirmaii]|uniref:Pertussis toxin, subunit 1 n=1 Tax=Xenorhabdus szentirmaii DSM 16338 TaxID=1427518 RepID=W1J0L3_9GAMM|nr:MULTISPECIES: enterotoxin A family protein [Xenorhabdus]MBD2781686.1 hypothetical protein [Xenorhabdus sp. 38]MBD2790878.1 hypothetical protein [Xenorhabdus sp. CUL]MBD2804430.1 hypothetical protein [Xenorhabdus sp. ZM]MBD2819922.1 hypothetical protein [Xenorhabdus sp. 42]MBD2825467.1 hypothetical protein [Xenorhabdus sp. 5]